MTNPIEELRRAHEATTQGLWQVNPFKALIDCEQLDEDGMPTPLLAMAWPTTYRSERETYANADFIALAHREWPALLDRIEALEVENARLREALQPFAKSGELLFRIGDSGRFWAYRPAGGDEYGITGTQLLEARTALGDPT